MEDDNKVNPDTVEQEVDTGIDNSSNDSSKVVDDERYLSQKRRAEKAEAELKALRGDSASAEKTAQPNSEVKQNITSDRDESYLISVFGSKGLGYDEINEYLEKAKKIATLEGVPLAKAIETDFFKIFDKSYQEEKKAQKAQLSASKGSGSNMVKKSFSTPNLSDAEFNEMLKKQVLGQ